jgi:hypothetical protein
MQIGPGQEILTVFGTVIGLVKMPAQNEMDHGFMVVGLNSFLF